jgi:hypothetical protein
MIDSKFSSLNLLFSTEKGKLFQWEVKSKFSQARSTSAAEDREDRFFSEIDCEIDGKSISKHVIKDIAFSSSTLFLATGKFFRYILFPLLLKC